MPSSVSQLNELWRRMSGGQRGAVSLAAVGTIALIVVLVVYGMQPEYGVLFTDLKPADAQQIVEKLKASSVQYQLSNGSTTVSVPSDRVSELRMQIAASGVISGGHVGFDIFDKTSFGATDFTQQVNYQRAIEGELSRTLEGMDEVESARVHITRPHESIFADKAERAKASAMLRVRQGRELSRERTEAIVNLMSSAVEGLDPADVSVMDTRGRILSAPDRAGATEAGIFGTHLESRRKLETDTATRIVALLEPITGSGHVRSDVAADLDFSQVEQTQEKFDPKSAVIRSQQTSLETRAQAASPVSGLSGARSNDPAEQPSPSASPRPASAAGGDQRTATTTTYEIDKTVSRTVIGGGHIKRLSVSVLVDYKMTNNVLTARTPEELQKVKELVSAAVGVDETRGDLIVVQTIPFDQPSLEPAAPQTFMEKNKELIKTGTKYGLLALAALLLIVFVIRPAKRAIRSAAMAAATHLLPAAPAPTLALPGGQMMSSQTQQFQSPEQRRLDTSRSVGADGGKTVAEMEAEMDAQIARELNSPVQEIKRARALQKQLVEKSKSEPQLIAMTLRGWLQDGK